MEYRNNLHSAPRDYRSYGAPSSPANCGGCRLRRAAVWVIQTVQHDGNDVPIKNQYLLRRIYLPGGSKLQPPFRRHFLLRRRYDGGSGCNFGSGFSGSGGGRSTAKVLDVSRILRMMSDYAVETVNDGTNEFNVEFHGPKESLYEGEVWKIRVKMPEAYPFKSPSFSFLNKIFHPNLFLYPNPLSPLNRDAASLMMNDPKQYEQKVKGKFV
ncbi:hypothetical protein ACLOJK_016512 [Asimina triloba]